MLIDTHTHIYAAEFDADANEMVARAIQAGVKKTLLPNVDEESIPLLHGFVDRYPDFAYPMMGLHPTSVESGWPGQLAAIKPLFTSRSYVAVGEIGLDLYWSKDYVKEQKAAFIEQLNWSFELDLPVSIHSRDAVPEVVACIHAVGADKLRGSFHSFGGSAEDLQLVLPLQNFMVGVNGVVTFKNSSLSTILKAVPLDRLLVETDAPYLTPVPYRGKRNEPSYIPYIIAKLAEMYDLPSEEIAQITTTNAERLFRL